MKALDGVEPVPPDEISKKHVREARDAWLAGGGVLVTTDDVIDETLTTIWFRIGLDASEKWWQQPGKALTLDHHFQQRGFERIPSF